MEQEEVGATNEETSRVFRDVFKGRKCWKTQKGGEMVWPPELEAALLEGMIFSTAVMWTFSNNALGSQV
jgi:hypothetical protein